MTFVARVLRYLRTSGMRPSAFGRAAMNDPRFVEDLVNGREPRDSTVKRVIAWIDEREQRMAETAR